MKLDLEEQHSREFVDGKVSKVKFVMDQNDNAYRFVTGFWDSPCNSVCCWNIVESNEANNSSEIEKVGEIKTGSDVNDLCLLSEQKIVVGLGNGTIKFIEIDETGKITEQSSLSVIYNQGCITSLCSLGDDIFVGSNTGQIVRVFSTSKGYSLDLFASNLMGVCCITPCGSNLFVSGHLTGQIHLWDIRAKRVAFTIPEIDHHIPQLSKVGAALNDAITAVASHPAEPNVIAYGTSSGSVSFIDIRQPEESFSSLFKITKDSINQLKFNPSYPTSFFSSSCSSIVHWDASSMSLSDNWDNKIEKMDSSFQDFDKDDSKIDFNNWRYKKRSTKRANLWLSSSVWDFVQLKSLIEDNSKYISAFDISKDSIVIGSNTSDIMLLENISF